MKKNAIAALSAITVLLSACGQNGADGGAAQNTEKGGPQFSMNGELIESADNGTAFGEAALSAAKPPENANPLISNIFCADPTAVEYEGRLYVYGTNDQQQYDEAGGENTYERINTLLMLSTDDMANWTYHGLIETKKISPYIVASWAPSIVSRAEEDGKTHFYLYYSNSGWGVGVLTAESPTGPWSDPIGRSLLDGNTKGLKGCKIPFDPGVVIDDDGVGWLSFGGGEDSGRIARLGSDMTSIDGEIMTIPSPYHNEASELNYINGTYVYTYCNDWNTRLQWDIKGVERPPVCSMAYFVTKTPLDSESYEYRGHYFKNPGEQGLEYSNNHTHLHKYQGKYYLFYHALFPQKALGVQGGFRSLCVNEARVDEDSVLIFNVSGNKTGVEQIKTVDPFAVNEAETMASSGGITYVREEDGTIGVSADEGGTGCIFVKGVEFGKSPAKFAVRAKGTGRIEVRAGSIDAEPVSYAEFDTADYSVIYNEISGGAEGTQDLYFIISQGAVFDEWQFSE